MPPKIRRNNIIVFAVALLFLSPHPLFSSQQKPESLNKSASYEALSAKVVKTIALPQGWHEGLSMDGTDVWVSNGKNGKVWVVDTDSGKVKSDLESIAGFTEAISRKKDGLFFLTDWDEKKLYMAQLRKDKFNPETWISTKPAHPAGVLWTGDRLFVITWTRGMGTKFSLLELDGKMNYLGTISIQSIQEPAHIAWDGKNLWITSWYDPLVYKIDVNKWEIIGSFRSPVSRTTGIAWDGKYLWLTGTYSDLYKMEVFG